jgi:glycosyltransferase involved in cell wall biosynthesis
VLYVVVMDPFRKLGSMEEQMSQLAGAFCKEHSLFLPLFDCPERRHEPAPLEQMGVRIECLDLRHFRVDALWRLLRVIRENRIEVVHWNFSDSVRNAYLWCLSVLRPGLRHYYTDHFSRSHDHPRPLRGWKRRVKQALTRRYDKVVCVSEYVKKCLEAEATWTRLVCQYHFVNSERFRPDSVTRSELRTAHAVADKFVALTVAHLIPEKGVDVLIHAMAQLPDNVHAWIVGGGPEEPELKRLASQLGLEDRVEFFGPQPYVESYMQAADCFVCPSRWAEAAGLVNLEAQSTGLPLIASDIGGIPEHLIDGQTGFLFPREDASALAMRIRELACDTRLTSQLGRQARLLVEREFSPAARLQEMVNLYRT